ncbi:hypothetical protein PUNSTDRAFT_77041, partial [Punctularia strigosozonata HHB-11173 SS5]
GWSDETLNDHFARQRASADTAGHELSLIWFNRMKDVLREVDKGTYCIEWTGPLQFLDLGRVPISCCPGGFTSYILNHHPRATGVGVSLEEAKGGHPYLLEHRLRSRFTLHSADILSFNLGTQSPDGEVDHPPIAEYKRHFGLVLVDGHYLRAQRAAHPDTPWDRHRVLISQLILALQTVKIGGTLIVKMSHPEAVPVAKLIRMLDLLSQTVRLWKPWSLHSTRGSFYVVAQGVGLGERGDRLQHYASQLKEVWQKLYSGGKQGRGRFMVDSDFDFVITNEDVVETYLHRLVKLATPVWRRQAVALQQWFIKHNITSYVLTP